SSVLDRPTGGRSHCRTALAAGGGRPAQRSQRRSSVAAGGSLELHRRARTHRTTALGPAPVVPSSSFPPTDLDQQESVFAAFVECFFDSIDPTAKSRLGPETSDAGCRSDMRHRPPKRRE